jgi:hypothetical protein
VFAEEAAQVGHQQVGAFQGGEMAAAVVFGPRCHLPGGVEARADAVVGGEDGDAQRWAARAGQRRG